MDETLSRVVVDCSNRPYLVWKVKMSKPKLGEMDTELFKEWFQAFHKQQVLLFISKTCMEKIIIT